MFCVKYCIFTGIFPQSLPLLAKYSIPNFSDMTLKFATLWENKHQGLKGLGSITLLQTIDDGNPGLATGTAIKKPRLAAAVLET